MKRKLWPVVAVLVGVLAPVGPTLADADHSAPHPEHTTPHGGGHDHGEHSHGMMAIPVGQPIPEVAIEVFADPVGGWNVQVQTANWTFAPERVNASSMPNEGHAHLYLNGEKITRLYGEWYYLPSLPPGEHVLTVGLNANGHEMLMHNGEAIAASVKVVVPESAAGQ